MLLLPDYWTWDFWLAQHDQTYHLYFLMAPRALGDPDLRHENARIGHATSHDLLNWEVLGEALGPGAPGAWDDQSTWTGSVIEAADGWHLYYTGVRRSERGLVQRIGRARSADLNTWTKDDDFVLEADPRWYEQLDLDTWFDLTWRDPWVYWDAESGEYRMLITARSNEGAPDARGVIGLARSADLETWEVLPPLASPGAFGHLEVPQLHRIRDRWYLVFSVYEWAHSGDRVARGLAVCGTHYLVSESARGPFLLGEEEFFSGDPRGELYAGRLIETFEGEHVFLAFLQFVDGGPFIGGLSDPFPVTVDIDGSLRIDRAGRLSPPAPTNTPSVRSA
ncbi:glycosyl hydrolase family 32 [Microbacterium sp. E-13]|uniref:glycosyl hydrolase family 32 n=1 Tax=Microbacterium sp. E-13 TaxID=3404048 RepID=UPI003CE885D5